MSLPEVPASFYWTDETWGAALRCRALEPVAQHLFTTRQLQLPSAAAWPALAAAIGVAADGIVPLNQVHGREVAVIRTGLPRERLRADALVSDAPDVALVVRAADCVPLLLADRRTGVVGGPGVNQVASRG